MSNPNLWLGGGVAGMVGICCYILAIAVPWPETQLGISASLVVVSAWPILSIIYSYALYGFVAAERESVANRLGLVFAITAFTTVLAMIVVQLAVGSGLGEITRDLDEPTARALRRGLRMIDLGLDVAWDMLIGTALVFSGLAIRKRSGLGLGDSLGGPRHSAHRPEHRDIPVAAGGPSPLRHRAGDRDVRVGAGCPPGTPRQPWEGRPT